MHKSSGLLRLCQFYKFYKENISSAIRIVKWCLCLFCQCQLWQAGADCVTTSTTSETTQQPDRARLRNSFMTKAAETVKK